MNFLALAKQRDLLFEEYYSSYSQLIKRTSWIFFALRKWKNSSKSEPDTELINPTRRN